MEAAQALQWKQTIDVLQEKLKTTQTHEDALHLLFILPDIIGDYHPNREERRQLSKFYASFLRHTQQFNTSLLTQTKLVDTIRRIISQNVKLRIRLDSLVWNEFFFIYYQLPMQFSHVYVLKLLTSCMPLPGSETHLNAVTVNIILSGIDATANDVDPMWKSLLFDRVVELLMKQQQEHERLFGHLFTYAPFLEQLQFKKLALSGGHFQCVIGLLMNHSDAIFAHAYGNINIFNDVLRHLPQYIIKHSLNASRSLELIMNKIMKNHDAIYNTDTYKALMYYHAPILPLCCFEQRHFNHHHHDIHEIVRRLAQVEKTKQSNAYQTFIACVRRLNERGSDNSGDKYLRIPDPIAKCTAGEWRHRFAMWEINVDIFMSSIHNRNRCNVLSNR
eukprot:196478_1